jgi:hypothetical protein
MHEIEKTIKSLKTKNSNGYDEMSVKILKYSTSCISSLTYKCNKYHASGTFPNRLKFSIVKPVFKIGDRYDICNLYMFISLLLSPEFLKRFTFARLYQHMNQNKIHVNEQCGFRSNS